MLQADIGSASDWQRICDEPIEEAIVVVLVPGQPAGIWDGWHRAGGSVHAGRTHIPAIVGTRRPSRT